MINYIPDKEDMTNQEIFFGLVLEFFTNELNEDAFSLFQLQLNPPPYILNRLKKSNSQIPLQLVLEFFNLENVQKNIKYIRQLRKEINLTIEKARIELNSDLVLQ
jgi:phage regulator Rha-like protein